jgi:hypothetical protein
VLNFSTKTKCFATFLWRFVSIIQENESFVVQLPCLPPFVGNPRDEMPKGLPLRLTDYMKLLDWSGRAIFENKRGFIPSDKPPMLERL